ncbi:NAD-P-binding protein [Russula earlei]|uniref:NAD-P-binding protein n=1 Tax=Russula earlei TaxID=71964 RepID=A0ACC0U690_9AGAM|nr:NAD-P-binding protein [Russula earlei]
MSGYKNFAIVGAGLIGSVVTQQFLKDKAAGTVNQVVVLTREGSKTSIEGDAKVIPVDYTNKESLKRALAGIDVVISTIAGVALPLQGGIAEAAKEVGVKLFVPSEFGVPTEGATEGLFGAKARVQDQLKAVGLSYALFYTGPFADFIWASFLDLDVTKGKVSVGGDGNKQISLTSRSDIARYISYVLTHLPAEQLNDRSFTIAGDNKVCAWGHIRSSVFDGNVPKQSFNEIFKAYEEKTGKKLDVTYIPVSEYDARLAVNPQDFAAVLHKLWATTGPFRKNDNHLYPDWNPSAAIDNVPVA